MDWAMRFVFFCGGIFSFLCLCACGSGSIGPPAGTSGERPSPFSDFWEGKNYERLRTQAPAGLQAGQAEVMLFFFFGCEYCRDLSPHIQAWAQKKGPQNVKLQQVPVVWDDPTRLQARVYYTADHLGKAQELHSQAFRAPLKTAEDAAALFARYGVDPQTFTTASSSVAVASRLEESVRLGKAYDVRSTPVIIVNGRYRTDLAMAGGQKRLLELLDELIAADSLH